MKHLYNKHIMLVKEIYHYLNINLELYKKINGLLNRILKYENFIYLLIIIYIIYIYFFNQPCAP